MKRDAKEAYVQALTEHARRKTLGATQPVVVDAYRFFDEAVSRISGLYHPFSKGNTKQILDQFTDDLQRNCVSIVEGFPIIVIKIAHDVIKNRHGKQAVVDADNTSENYKEAATVCPHNPYSGWALFSPGACKDHPIVGATFSTQRDRINTSQQNFNRKVAKIDPTLRIVNNDKVAIESAPPV